VNGPFEVNVLGSVEARLAGAPIELPRGRSRALLAVLALGAGRIVSTDRLVDELWGQEPPATVITALHGLVAGLRQRIEPDRVRPEPPRLLVTRSPGYLLDVPAERVDAHRFRALVGRAASAPVEERARVLREALALWRGPALAGVALAGPAAGEVAALEELRLGAHEQRVDADLALGRHRELLAEVESLVAAHPYRERLHGQLMLALFRSGRQRDALDVWRRARALLIEEVGVEPGPGLRTLHQAILEHDPALDVAAADPRERRDGTAHDLAARAGELLAAAGSRVYERHYDAPSAEELFSGAELLLPADHPQRDDVVNRVSEIYLMLGRHDDADARLKQAMVAALRRGDTRRVSHLRLERARIQLIIGPDPIPMDELAGVGRRALEDATRAGDDAVVSQACYVLGLVALRRGDLRRMEALARQAMRAAERSGQTRERLAARWWLALALVEGSSPTDDVVIAQCEELVDLGAAEHPGVLSELARLHALRGAHDIAREHLDRAVRNLQRRPGLRRPAMFVARRAGEVELASDHPERAEPHLRNALALADDLGEADERAQVAAKLARVLAHRGDMREAAELAHKSRHTAPRESVTAQALWRAAAAAVRSGSGDHAAARALLDDATALVPGDLTLLTADLVAQRATLP
jgi:DNA-binding SARP family transcriptional activator